MGVGIKTTGKLFWILKKKKLKDEFKRRDKR